MNDKDNENTFLNGSSSSGSDGRISLSDEHNDIAMNNSSSQQQSPTVSVDLQRHGSCGATGDNRMKKKILEKLNFAELASSSEHTFHSTETTALSAAAATATTTTITTNINTNTIAAAAITTATTAATALLLPNNNHHDNAATTTAAAAADPSTLLDRESDGYSPDNSDSSTEVEIQHAQQNDDEEEEHGTNIIINYLPPSMTQDEIRTLFSRVGEVDSCKLVRDKVTGESLGYAFVNFARSEDAANAIRTLNGLRLQNKTIKVSRARPSSETIKGANLYISGLPKSMDQSHLEQLFCQCGKIITARILFDNKTGISRGVAFIRYDQRNEAEAAIARFDGFMYDQSTEPINVKFANAPGISRNDSLNALLLQQAAQLNPLAAQAPALVNTLLNPVQQLSTIARIKYAMNSSAPVNDLITAMTAMNPLLAATCGALTSSGWCIFIYNLAPEVDESAIWQLFGPFGAVQSVKIIREPNTHKCRGYGFVTMSNYEEALLSIQSLNGFTLNGRVLQVSFKTSPAMTAQKSVKSPIGCSPISLSQLQEVLSACVNVNGGLGGDMNVLNNCDSTPGSTGSLVDPNLLHQHFD